MVGSKLNCTPGIFLPRSTIWTPRTAYMTAANMTHLIADLFRCVWDGWYMKTAAISFFTRQILWKAVVTGVVYIIYTVSWVVCGFTSTTFALKITSICRMMYIRHITLIPMTKLSKRLLINLIVSHIKRPAKYNVVNCCCFHRTFFLTSRNSFHFIK